MLTSVLPGTIAASAAAVENDNSSSSEYEGLASGCEEIDFSTLSDDEIISSHSEYDHCPLNHIDQYMIIPNFEP